MTQEELKTCLGQLLLDLRGNWAYGYEDRMKTALVLCSKIELDTSDIQSIISNEIEEGDYDGRCFRGCSYYQYKSDKGTTEEVKEWLKFNLSNPEYCELLD